MTCHQCGKELPECGVNEPYPWCLVEEYLYCLDCMNN